MNIVGIKPLLVAIRALCASCDRFGRSAWPEVAPGLTPDSIPQKYDQTIASTQIVPGCVQFLGEKKFLHTWTQLGHSREGLMDVD